MKNKDEIQQVMCAMSPQLRALLDAELAAGNEIDHLGHGHPAPPIGAYLMLKQAILTCDKKSATGLRWIDRNSSLYGSEITDSGEKYWILTPAPPPPPEPDMDAIRKAHEPTWTLPRPAWMEPGFAVDVDIRGEMMIYRETNRRADIVCTFGGGQQTLCPDTLSDWWYPSEKRSEKMTSEERDKVLQRIIDSCRSRHGMTKLVIEE